MTNTVRTCHCVDQ